MRRFVIGSHHRLAYGLRDTLEFLTCKENIIDISAYVDDTDAEGQIAQVFASIAPEDEVIIMTDMLGGSVNQKFCSYMAEHRHLISGINLPCALSLALQPEDTYLTEEQILQIVEESRNHLIYVNKYQAVDDQADE